MSILGIIPARFGSTRLPGKPLIKVHGKSIIQRVYERVKMATSIDRVIVATDDVRVLNHVRKFGGEAISTRIDHRNGTQRCAEVMESVYGFEYVVNIQGDEPLVNPGEIDRLCTYISSMPEASIATLIKHIDSTEELHAPGIVKVVTNKAGRALYFSRSTIPFNREHEKEMWLEQGDYYKHIGLYAYSARVLEQLATLGGSALEDAEMLEQLNWLYHGYDIYTLETESESIGIDTPEDVALLEHLLSLAED